MFRSVTRAVRPLDPKVKQHIIGIPPGEKVHEQMIGPEDSRHTYEYDAYYKIVPAINDGGNESRIKGGRKVCSPFGIAGRLLLLGGKHMRFCKWGKYG
jgi:UDP-N-acetylglucosamine 4,6-dehydratase